MKFKIGMVILCLSALSACDSGSNNPVFPNDPPKNQSVADDTSVDNTTASVQSVQTTTTDAQTTTEVVLATAPTVSGHAAEPVKDNPLAQETEDHFNKNTIRLSDIPKDAPKFSTYPTPKYDGPIASPDVESHPRSKLYRTKIREGVKDGPNFAGHYTIVWWGCGTSCSELAIVDVRNGKVFHPRNIRYVVFDDVDPDALRPPKDLLVQYHVDSNLMVIMGGINEDPKQRGISYFLWQRNQLKRIRFVPRPYE